MLAERTEQLTLFGLETEATGHPSSDAGDAAGAEAAVPPTGLFAVDGMGPAVAAEAGPAIPVAGAEPAIPVAEAEPAIPAPGQDGLFGGRATKADALAALAARARECRRCRLREGCRGVVFGEGDPDSTLVFLGEGPGAVEDELGRPFVGPAGQLLDKILLAVGFRRHEVYITNTVLCRPPGNRVPLPDEVAACRIWLEQRLAIMRPAIIVCLGVSAAQSLLGNDLRISRDRGRWYSLGEIRVLPTFHPAALLRDPSKKRPVWEDMKAVRAEWLRLCGESSRAG